MQECEVYIKPNWATAHKAELGASDEWRKSGFEDWERVLRATVPEELRRLYQEAVVKFRHWLKEMGKEATARCSGSMWPESGRIC